MRLLYIDIPNVSDSLFNKNFVNKVAELDGVFVPIHSTGTSWNYPSQIKGWRDWDFTSQSQGKFREVDEFAFTSTDILVTMVRNPFNLLYQYFLNDWAWCRKYHNLPTDNHTIEDFHKFVDIYLDRSIVFHAPSFRKSLFSQLKNINGDWLLGDNSIILRYEDIITDINRFSKYVGVNDINLDSPPKQIDYFDMYTKEHIKLLTTLWKDDLEYFDYSFDGLSKKTTKFETKKPKIALCLSGLIRDIDYTKPFWKNLINKYDVDVYGSFWDDENKENGDTIDNLKSIFNFKELEFEKYSNFKKSTLDVITPYIVAPSTLLSELQNYTKSFHTLSMWYKIWKTNMLSKNLNISYDIVIRGRTDMFIDGDLDIMVNDYLNVPSGRVKTHNWENSDGVCDIFGFGKPKLMDYYASTYLNIMEYVNQGHYMIPPENLLRVHLSKINLNIRFFKNRLTITRYCKGIPNEIYDRRDDVEEEILPSTFVKSIPNKDIIWTTSVKNSLKF